MLDFTLRIYEKLLKTILDHQYNFLTFREYLNNTGYSDKLIILRHDVDRLPHNSQMTAILENKMGIRGTYYFRTKACSFIPEIIEQIEKLGHEIGYHYENMENCGGNFEQSIIDFENNLNKMRKVVRVDTICMHGSPLSKWDNRDLWKKYDYSDFGILGEPYFDILETDISYLTDTGRSWDGRKISIRDKINDHSISDLSIKKTSELIEAGYKMVQQFFCLV